MFADRAKIYIRSGKGGDGHVSFTVKNMLLPVALMVEMAVMVEV